MIEVKTRAPIFNLKNQYNIDISLDDYHGKKLFVFFCPDVNDVPSRTFLAYYAQKYERMRQHDIEIVGIFGNDIQSLYEQSKAYFVPFPLLSDPDMMIRKAYDVWNKKITFGTAYWISTRCAVLINENGIIEKVFKKIHTDEKGIPECNYMEHALAKAKWRTLSRRKKERLKREFCAGTLDNDEMITVMKALNKNWNKKFI